MNDDPYYFSRREFVRYAYYVAVNCITQTFNYTYIAVIFFLMYFTMWRLKIPFDNHFFALSACLIGFLQYGVMDFLFQSIRNLIEYLAAEKRIQVVNVLANILLY